MLETLIISSTLLVVLSERVKFNFFVPAVRLIQILVTSYCLYSGKLGFLGEILKLSVPTLMFYILPMMLISISLEMSKFRSIFKEVLFLLFTLVVASTSISTILASYFVISLVLISERKSFLIDYIALLFLSIISMIYFSEIATTVPTTKDVYYIFSNPILDKVFYPLLMLFVCFEVSRLWGYKRELLVFTGLMPFILLFRLQNANYLDESITYFSIVLLVFIFWKLRKIIKDTSIDYTVNFLLEISLFFSIFYFQIQMYDWGVSTALVTFCIYIIYKIVNHYLNHDEEIKKIVIVFALFNLSCIPISSVGLKAIDVLSRSEDVLSYFILIVGICLSIFALGNVAKRFFDELHFNILEASARVKTITFSLVVISLLLVPIDLTYYFAGTSSSHSALFNKMIGQVDSTFLSFNLNFLLILFATCCFGYLMKIMPLSTLWRLSFKVDELINALSVNIALKTNKRPSLQRVDSKVEEVQSEGILKTSSYTIAFYILVFFLIISLIIIEL